MLACLLVPIFTSFVSESPPPQGADSLLCSPWHNRALFRDGGSMREKGKDGQLPAGLAMSLFPDQQPGDSEVTARWQRGGSQALPTVGACSCLATRGGPIVALKPCGLGSRCLFIYSLIFRQPLGLAEGLAGRFSCSNPQLGV